MCDLEESVNEFSFCNDSPFCLGVQFPTQRNGTNFKHSTNGLFYANKKTTNIICELPDSTATNSTTTPLLSNCDWCVRKAGINCFVLASSIYYFIYNFYFSEYQCFAGRFSPCVEDNVRNCLVNERFYLVNDNIRNPASEILGCGDCVWCERILFVYTSFDVYLKPVRFVNTTAEPTQQPSNFFP